MKNIFLDLDNTLISSEIIETKSIGHIKNKAANFECKNMDNYFLICARPYLQPFLDFLFKNFKVNIWTAASKDYAMFIIDEFILKKDPTRKIHLILYDYHCKISQKIFKTPKKLEVLWSKWKLYEYDYSNTIIIDDLERVCESQPSNCINIKPFNFLTSENDSSLKKIQRILCKWR
jgi:TFIIF-interacting CTD phosphatase-like protein